MQKLLVITLILLLLLTACNKQEPNQSASSSLSEASIASSANTIVYEPNISDIKHQGTESEENESNINKDTWHMNNLIDYLYESPKYSIISSELIDTYFIACGIYFGFQGDYLFCDDMNIDYRDTINYFETYKNHEFVMKLGTYLDTENQYAAMNILYSLPQYVITGAIIEEDADFSLFLDELYQFYIDSKAAVFFQKSNLHKELNKYIYEDISSVPVSELFAEMEEYTGNKTKVFGNNDVHYYSVISIYKSPYNATFHYYQVDDKFYIISFQSPLGFNGELNISQTIETAIHESLHLFINPCVEANRSMIDTLAQYKNTSDFTSQLYINMPWYRITDEAIVRVVQARIYGAVYNDYDRAFRQILEKEIQSGFVNLEAMFNSLKTYEQERNQYKTIEDFSIILMQNYLNE